MIRLIPLVLLSLLIPFPGHSGPISDYICGETNTLPESIESQSWQQVLAALAEERTDSETENGFEGSHTHRLSNGYSASLFYYIPKSYDPAEATPLLMTLHGGVSTFRSAPGKDVLPRWKEWADENGFIVAAPSSNGNNPWWFREGEEHILESLRFLAANYHLDRNRVVLSGASDGATGTFSLGTRFTDLWSACLAWQGSYQVLTNASPLMGGVQPFFTRNAASIPWRITHGELDELYPGASQTGAIKRLDRAGTKVDWEVHPGLGHDTVATIEIEQPLLASWLSGKERDPYPDLIDWTVIDPIRYGRAYWVRVNRLSQWKQDPFTDLPDLTVPVSKPRPTSAIFGIQFDRDYSGRGARVLGVANYSSAQSSGIRGGDIIVGVGDSEIENLSDLQSAITGEESESSQRTVRYLRDAGTYTARFNLFPVKAPIPDHSQAGRIRVERSGNQIKIRTHQIGAFEVLISPEEFDLSQEVTISVQGNEKFRGMIRPDSVFMLDEMRERSGDTASVYVAKIPIILDPASNSRSASPRVPIREHRVARVQKEVITTVDADDLDENSGMSYSRNTPNAVWTHNDSGGTPVLYLISLENGSLLATIELDGTINRDWEDITSFEIDGIAYLAVGDIGDNSRKREKYQICILKEPILEDPGGKSIQLKFSEEDWVDLRFRYSDGSHNCEALAWDPLEKQFLLVTKAGSQKAGLYTLGLPATDLETPAVAAKQGEIDIQNVSAMDISRDGTALMIRAYDAGYFFSLGAADDWKEVLRQPLPDYVELPVQIQGESACFLPDGKSVLIATEKKKQPIFRIWMDGSQ